MRILIPRILTIGFILVALALLTRQAYAETIGCIIFAILFFIFADHE